MIYKKQNLVTLNLKVPLLHVYYNTGTSKKKKKNMVKKFFFSCNFFQKVKLSYILDSLHVKKNTQRFLCFNFDDD